MKRVIHKRQNLNAWFRFLVFLDVIKFYLNLGKPPLVVFNL